MSVKELLLHRDPDKFDTHTWFTIIGKLIAFQGISEESTRETWQFCKFF
jgi:hypothetical protein